MQITMLQGKIHRATVTQAELDYVGSITVDEDLLDAAGIREYQMVQIVDVNNGNRFETYTIAGERGSGVMCLNGAAARCASVNDKMVVLAGGQGHTGEVGMALDCLHGKRLVRHEQATGGTKLGSTPPFFESLDRAAGALELALNHTNSGG